MLTEQTLTQFKNSIKGKTIFPQDDDYDNSRKVYNGMINKRPAMIVQCADIADVIACVNFARENHLLVAVRGGGHNAGGLGVCDDGMVIDLSRLKSVLVDPVDHTVRAEGGCTLADIDHATAPFGLAVPFGVLSTTGIAGLTLGGGIGYLTRKFGLTIDNLLEAHVVLADGRYVKASVLENEDLFWALRGGGGNFGVVTSFLFRAHPLKEVYGGPMLWELDDAKEIMQWYREYIVDAPTDINGFFAFLTVPPAPHFPEALHLKKMCGIVWCYTGAMDKKDEVFREIKKAKEPAFDATGTLPIAALQSMFDALLPPGMYSYWKADFVNELTDEAIDLHIKHARLLPSMQSTMHLYPINGAAAEVKNDETTWNFRKVNWAEVIVGFDTDAANKEKITKWVKDYWEELHPYSAGGAYINFIMDEGDERLKTTYGDNYERLVKIKNKYDPDNLFRVNHNIKPVLKKQPSA